MTEEAFNRRQPDLAMERRVDQLDAKIDRIGDAVDRQGSEARSGFETLMKQIDERWSWIEKNSAMEARNQKQSIELLTASLMKLQQDVSSAETQVDLLATDQKVGTTKIEGQKQAADQVHAELARRIEQISENLKWVARALAGVVFTIAGACIIYFVTHPT